MNRVNVTTAAFVMAGMVCAMVVIFTSAFSGTAPVNPDLVGILPAQGCINAGKKGTTQGSFGKTGPAGLVTQPSCDQLIRDLRQRNALVIPEKEEELSLLLREAVETFLSSLNGFSSRGGVVR